MQYFKYMHRHYGQFSIYSGHDFVYVPIDSLSETTLTTLIYVRLVHKEKIEIDKYGLTYYLDQLNCMNAITSLVNSRDKVGFWE